MFHPSKAVTSPAEAARKARRELGKLSRPSPGFDASRYFRDAGGLQFLNVGTDRVRAMARDVVRAHPDWSVNEAVQFAGTLIADPHLEVKGLAIEVLGRYRRTFTPSLLRTWKGWLANGYASNWATTDAICGLLIGPLVLKYPRLAKELASWPRHSSLWVRRASAVGLIPLARRGQALTQTYGVARQLHADSEDLIHKAVGWTLREAGKTDMDRLERYLIQHGSRIPRTTVRYAIERFPAARRRALLLITRGVS
jgi:3-methyladenine DNA glycosylase AlkD